MRFKITFILICLETLLFCCTAVPLEFNTNENERIPGPISSSEEGFDDDSSEEYEDFPQRYVLTTDEHKNNSLEDLITEIDEEVEQLFNENELQQHLMEEDTNCLDIIAQKVAGLHPNSSVERYDSAVLGIGQKLELSDWEPRGFVTGSRAMVRFTANRFFTGEGFRLRFLKRLDFDTTVEPGGSKCGGVVVGQTGYLNYKLGKDYSNNERCVWLLHSPGSESIHLQLIDDGFQIWFDYLSVNTIDLETGAIRNDMKQFNARNWTQTIEAPLLVIFFISNEFLPGKGFSLKDADYKDSEKVSSGVKF
ncbi:unnamed protein product [Orchesella dallaii]|uniref:CUB domain-containing protein n=1 Tax=Orchesella dallaii TaxID=48710 RepID=A0ABP1S8W1_9HEXA